MDLFRRMPLLRLTTDIPDRFLSQVLLAMNSCLILLQISGWKISLDRGLDIFQRYEMNDAFSLSNRLQEFRSAKAFEITYLKNGSE